MTTHRPTAPAHRRPRPGTLYERDSYWQTMEAARVQPAGATPDRPAGLPAWSFDFISIHHTTGTGYSLLSPMCIVEQQPQSRRPSWERDKHATKRQAVQAARRLARHHQVFIVDCH